MRLIRTAAMAAVMLLRSTGAVACGHCIEDRIAAVYDHAAVTAALAAKHQIAFFAIDGRLEANSAQGHSIKQAAAKAAGVDARSIRVSVESAALSVSFDPSRISAEQLRQSLQGKLVMQGLSLQLLRIMKQPAEVDSVPAP